MSQDVNKLVESLRCISPSLNTATDEAARVVAMVEKFLNEECSIGLPAEVPVEASQLTPKTRRITFLAYRRLEGKFCIAVEIGVRTDSVDECGHADSAWKEEKVIRWASATRELKLKTFEKLPELLARIADTASETAEKTATTSDTVGKLLDALNKK